MKTYKIKFRVIDKDNFNDIKEGRKVFETRAATVKYKNMAVGDKLEISCGKNKVIKTITKVRYFRSIDAMLKAIPLKKIMPDVASIAQAKKRWYGYPNYKEKIKENGIVALLLE